MKKIILILIFATAFSVSFAQSNISYTAFIQQDTAIKWAAECNKIANLTPKVSDYSIKQFYLTKLKNGTANGFKLNDDKRSVSGISLGKLNLERPDWLKGLACKFISNENVWAFLENNDPMTGYRLDSIGNNPCCGCDESEAIRVKQILYYKNYRFCIQNVFLSPLCAHKEDNGKAKWYPVCNVAFNAQIDNNKPIPLSKDLVLINAEKIKYTFKKDNTTTEDSILTIGSESIFQQLFNDIYHGRVKVTDTKTGKLIPGKKFSTWGTTKMLIPEYDNEGNEKGIREFSQERNPEKLSQILVQQEWYFDFKNEKLYSRIKWIDLLEEVITSQGIVLGTTAFCRINY